MKNSFSQLLFPVIAALALCSPDAKADAGMQNGRFAITSATFTPGGERLAGGRFSLRAAIGQHDGGALRGGRFALQGGSIPGLTLQQSAGAPLLKIRTGDPGKAVVSWPLEAQGWMLEETSSLNTGQWKMVLTPVVDTASEHTVTVPMDGLTKCFRLRKL